MIAVSYRFLTFISISILAGCVNTQLTGPEKKTSDRRASTDNQSQKSSEPYYNYNNTLPQTNNGQNTDDPDTPVNSDCYKGEQKICEIELEIVRQTNVYRGTRGDLEANSELAFVSRDWSKKMNDLYRLNHTGFPSWRDSAYQKEFNKSPNFYISAENIAMSYCEGSAEEIARMFVDMWWNSPGHRQNMVGDYKSLGAGVHIAQDGECYGTQIFGS